MAARTFRILLKISRLLISHIGLEEAGDEDRSDGERADVADEEPQDAEKLGVTAEGATICELILDIGLLEAPADKEDCQKAAERHEDV